MENTSECRACGNPSPISDKFCRKCGMPAVEQCCLTCGTPSPDKEKFCRKCGTPAVERCSCGVPLNKEVTFCENCGKRTKAPEPKPIAPVTPDFIREGLKGYDELVDATCLECGYKGPMGVTKTTVPWYCSRWMIVPLAACTGVGVGLIGTAVLAAGRHLNQTHHMVCPACRREIHEIKQF